MIEPMHTSHKMRKTVKHNTTIYLYCHVRKPENIHLW